MKNVSCVYRFVHEYDHFFPRRPSKKNKILRNSNELVIIIKHYALRNSMVLGDIFSNTTDTHHEILLKNPLLNFNSSIFITIQGLRSREITINRHLNAGILDIKFNSQR